MKMFLHGIVQELKNNINQDVNKVIIHWYEGLQFKDVGNDHIFKTLAEAKKFLHRVSGHMRPKSGYTKVKYTVVFNDGATYAGRFDTYAMGEIQDGGTTSICLISAMASYISYLLKDDPNCAEKLSFMDRLNNLSY